MDYFEAVQEGRRRVNEAIKVLQEVAGPSSPMLFLKLGITDWTPVGTEMLYVEVPGKNGTAAVAICDSDGNAKTMSAWLPQPKADEVCANLEKHGLRKFDGDVKLPI